MSEFEEIRNARIMINHLVRKEERKRELRKRERLHLALLGTFLMGLSVSLSLALYFDPMTTPFMFVVGLVIVVMSLGE